MIQSVGQHGLNLKGNQLGDEGWGAIFAGICGNKDSKIMSMDASSERIGPAGSKLIAETLRTSVTGALTEVNLDCYALGALPIKKLKGTEPDESLDLAQKGLRVASAIVIASLISDNGGLTSLDLSNNALCGVVQSFGEGGTYTAEGIKAIADVLRVNGALTRVDVRFNKIAGDGAAQLSAAVLGNLKFDMFNKIPIKKMRADSFTELDLKAKYIGVEGAMVVAGLIPVMGALTVANLLGSDLDAESAKMLVQVAKQKGISLCGIQRDQTTADFSSQGLLPPDAILLASDLSQAVITGALTNMSLACNMLDEEGTKAICKALKHNKTLKELDLSGFVRSNIGGAAGAKHVADMLGVNSGADGYQPSGQSA
ncbi:protein nlrc3 [Chrysochromulina tobinii]|uniref:Protein nlrc3 n=1 Tax=Chrysochromulina tobinii TaxID=1460289 RepID=A0A0M0JHT1_9EUKA|nr:protein nlrc3 [Chrysochromulina tobinii]|eukprot:KOO25897.1 protein nlrc3 [Chrysochromulina sp. CCMP291]